MSYKELLKLETQLIVSACEHNSNTANFDNADADIQRETIRSALVFVSIAHNLSKFVELDCQSLYAKAPELFVEIAAAEGELIRSKSQHSAN